MKRKSYIGVDYSTQTSDTIVWWCSICKKDGHTAQQHKLFPEIYGKVKKK